MKQQHIIRNQIMEVVVHREQDAEVLRREMGKTFQKRVLPTLDELFSSLVPADQHLRFDNLEINLGEIDPFRQQELFGQKFIACIKEAIEKKLNKARMARVGKTIATNSNEDVIWVAASAAHVFQQCRYFLETGLLPWWAGKEQVTFFEKLLEMIRSEPTNFAQQMKVLFEEKPQLVRRYCLQFPLAIQEKIRELLLSDIHQEIKQVNSFAIELLGATRAKKLQEELTLKSFIQPHLVLENFIERLFFIYQNEIKTAPKPIQLTEMPTFKKMKKPLQTQVQRIAKKLASTPLGQPTTMEQSQDQSPQPESRRQSGTETESPSQAERSQSRAQQATAKSKKQKNTASLEEKRQISKLNKAFAEGVLVQNAGLVLLTPFLSQFFKNLGLTEEKAFKDEASKKRAVLLTQYLVNPSNEVPEYELTLNKLLCALPQTKTLSSEINLTEQEKKEVDELLTYAISNWTALKSTSPDLLRTAFLQREGRLIIEDGNWTLQVDQQTHDILLSRIPWGFSLIKLPWMEEFLHVEWGY